MRHHQSVIVNSLLPVILSETKNLVTLRAGYVKCSHIARWIRDSDGRGLPFLLLWLPGTLYLAI